MVKIIRYILFPFALIYGIIVAIRNYLFDKQILKSSEFDVKTIQVGNLSVGGTGKTPHIEYLIRLLKGEYKLATLSRGYGRKTQGFISANDSSTAKEIGDEPLQFHQKFMGISVNVDAKRVNGIIEIMSEDDKPDVILMDDAYQHRSVKSGFSILLTDFKSPFYRDFMLPSGNLREFSSGKKRADVIVVTKCPQDLSSERQQRIKDKISPDENQAVFFSAIQYGKLISLWDESICKFHADQEIILVTGIANPLPLLNFIEDKVQSVTHIKYPDHHPFSEKNIQHIITTFESLETKEKVIITTEKDAMRLMSHEKLKAFPIYYIEIEVDFITKKTEFNQLIESYVKED